MRALGIVLAALVGGMAAPALVAVAVYIVFPMLLWLIHAWIGAAYALCGVTWPLWLGIVVTGMGAGVHFWISMDDPPRRNDVGLGG